jgi:hypothetical protein
MAVYAAAMVHPLPAAPTPLPALPALTCSTALHPTGTAQAFERAALVVGGGWAVALTGRNFFFPNKPDDFHAAAAAHARASALLQLAVVLAAGPGALLWLYWAEVTQPAPSPPAPGKRAGRHAP